MNETTITKSLDKQRNYYFIASMRLWIKDKENEKHIDIAWKLF